MADMKMEKKFGRYDFAAYVTFVAYAMSSMVIPLSLPQIASALGFPLESGGLTSGGALQIARAIPMVLSMIFCGTAAAKFGLRRVLLWSVIVMGVGIGLASTACNYLVLFALLFIGAMGEGMIEGLATPFVQQLHDEDASGYISISHSFWSIGVIVTTLLGGYALASGVSWRLVVLFVALLSLPAMLLLRDTPNNAYPERKISTSSAVVRQQAAEILTTPRFWLFWVTMIFAGGGEFGITFWTASYVQLTFGSTPWFAGVSTASFALGMFVGRSLFGMLVPQRRLYHLVQIAGLGGVLVSGVLPLLGTDWLNGLIEQYPILIFLNSRAFFCIMLLFAGGASAPFWPSIQSYTTIRLPKLDSTMQFVILSCAGVPGCALLTFVMGFVGNVWGMRAALMLVPICYALMVGLLALERSLRYHSES